MLTEAEQKLLSLIAEKQLVRKSDILNGNSSNIAILRNLIDKGLVQSITPMGENCFALTKKGSRLLNDIL